MTSVLETTTDGHLRVLRLNRPERKNALTGELIGGITGALREAAADDDVWAVAITGNGDAFCSGLDLADHPQRVRLGRVDHPRLEEEAHGALVADRLGQGPREPAVG
jgi:enoyl-CoA hydratase/carnithine racemase